ncbi:protein lethal(2)essential for life [Megalopta genalis]|uniref:protein lethal(2)essential for life n=1 Tax=Megalopta genalis TaxID=115081 RepID=UPI00144323C9|nr:protein lethal(2)essential for life-like [Megalopta genalis]
MSLLPVLFSNWWEDLERPHRIFDQHFGLPLSIEDLPTPRSLAPTDTDILILRPRRRGYHRYQPYERSVDRKSSGVSTIDADKNKFQVTLDVHQFAPDEVKVKVLGKSVVVEGKHEEKQDEHGWISRQFVRKYFVPEQCEIDELKCSLSSDGVLTITSPRKDQNSKLENERVIEIENTGKPALREEAKPSEKENQNEVPVQKNSVQERTRAQEQTVKAA